MSKKIFIAFGGQDIEQSDAVLKIGDGYECWNLKKFNRDDFISALQSVIPPQSDNFFQKYKAEDSGISDTGVTVEKFGHCSWGLLIPDSREDILECGFSEALFLLNLYSPHFLHPLFYAGDLGVRIVYYQKNPVGQVSYPNYANVFSTSQFVLFYKTFLDDSQYGVWQLDRIQSWEKEDWRLFTAAMLYNGLEDYENKKSTFGWQSESAHMAGVLECLFTAGDGSREEVGYRLRKRIAALLSFRFRNIESDIKDLYNQRSDFVHGNFFEKIPKEMKKSQVNMPIPDFDFLYSQKEYIRWAIVAYLYLANSIKERPIDYGGREKVIDLLEDIIVDVLLRDRVIKELSKVFALMA